VQKLQVPLQPVELTGKRIPLGQRKLACDEECAKLERKRLLADAFDITPPNLEGVHFGENSLLSDLLADLYRRDPKWVLAVEERCKYLVLGKSKGTSSSLKVHVFCPMTKDKRDALRLIADRWKLKINAAGWEPKRFIVVHATPKSKPPARVIGPKGSPTFNNTPHPPVYDSLVDMDPRLVVSFLDLPREADISALVLRFGGECELVWLNDKNALAVFSDPSRAATAMRRLDHGSVYHGAVVVLQSGGASTASSAWGGAGMAKELAPLKTNPWKNSGVQEPGWRKDSWGSEDCLQASAWKGNDSPIAASVNRWSILDSESTLSSSTVKVEDPATAPQLIASSSTVLPATAPDEAESCDVADDWEKVCD
jgi:transcriptional repressor NF-X1